jgi:hypothetical protein
MKATIRVKEEMIGATTWIKGIGHTTIGQRHALLLAQAGRFEFLDGVVPATKLIALADKTVKELRETAEGLDGYSLKLKKDELIDLINAAPSA